MKPVILITAGIENTNRGLIQSYCYKTYSEAIGEAGGLALIVGDNSDPEALAELADGLYLTGGNDINPDIYGGDIHLCEELDPWRDQMELDLVHAFIDKKKPIFGICRGMQMINVALGGTLIEDIENRTGYVHKMHSTHMIYTREDSDLRKWYGESFLVNSFHHQAIKELADNLEVTAWTKEGIIESIVHKTLPIYAMQWHPERMTGADPFTPIGPDMDILFKSFCNLCSREKEQRNK